MMYIDWLFLGGVIVTILLTIAVFQTLFLRVILIRKLKIINDEKGRSKTIRQIKRKEKKRLSKKISQNMTQLISFIILVCLLGVCTGGLNYYLTTSLSEKDSEEIVKAYYLLEETGVELQDIKEGNNPEKARNNLRELTARLASFGIYRADSRLTLARQKELNHYYLSLQQLGLNLSNQTTTDLQEEDVLKSYLADITKCQDNQKKVFETFNLSEDSLNKNKEVAKSQKEKGDKK